MSISLKAMRYFCTALEQGSIARAAAELNVAASAVATAIDQIEAQFGLSLTIRQRARGIEATADGRIMAGRFRALLDEYEAVLRDGADRRQSLSGELRIGYYAPVAPAFLPGVLAPLAAPPNSMTFRLTACDTAAAQTGLLRGDFDAILYASGDDHPGIVTETLVAAPPYILAAAGHPVATGAPAARHDLAGQPFALLDLPGIGPYYRELLADLDPPARIVAQCNSLEMVRSLVGQGDILALLNMRPQTAETYAGDRLVAVPLRHPALPVILSVGVRRGAQRRAVTAFVAACRETFAAPDRFLCAPQPAR